MYSLVFPLFPCVLRLCTWLAPHLPSQIHTFVIVWRVILDIMDSVQVSLPSLPFSSTHAPNFVWSVILDIQWSMQMSVNGIDSIGAVQLVGDKLKSQRIFTIPRKTAIIKWVVHQSQAPFYPVRFPFKKRLNNFIGCSYGTDPMTYVKFKLLLGPCPVHFGMFESGWGCSVHHATLICIYFYHRD